MYLVRCKQPFDTEGGFPYSYPMQPPSKADTVATILVVEDSRTVRRMLANALREMGHTVLEAADGLQAVEQLRACDVDLVLLDIVMPGMNGFEVLECMRGDKGLCHLPVIVISTFNEVSGVIRCMELGAEDYLLKPVDRFLLEVRINASLEKKRLHDQEKAFMHELLSERERSERLLLNVLPQSVAERLKQGERIIADRYESASVLFADIVDFTADWDGRPPVDMVQVLGAIYSVFDRIVRQHGVEKIKTIGDAYMAVCGCGSVDGCHAEAMAHTALDMQAAIRRFLKQDGTPYQLRIGIAAGPVVAGVIGTRKFSYDVWGDTVNTASRMQYHGPVNGIQVTPEVYGLLKGSYRFEKQAAIAVKGKGRMTTYLLTSRACAEA